jgi:hypothetical protein
VVDSFEGAGSSGGEPRHGRRAHRHFDDVRLTDAIGAENFFVTASAVRDCAARLGAADAPGGEQ